MIIELAGSSGAGKSTVADLVQELLQQQSVHALPAEAAGQAILHRLRWRTPWQQLKAWQGLQFSLEHPALAWMALAAQWARPIPWQHRRWVLRWFFATGGLYRFCRGRAMPHEVAVFNEGLLHCTVSLFTSEHEPPAAVTVARYVHRLPRPDLLIVLEVPPALCVERLKRRALPLRRLQGSGPEATLPFVEHAAQAVAIATNEARQRNWPLLVIDNTVPLAQVRETLRAHFRGLGTFNAAARRSVLSASWK